MKVGDCASAVTQKIALVITKRNAISCQKVSHLSCLIIYVPCISQTIAANSTEQDYSEVKRSTNVANDYAIVAFFLFEKRPLKGVRALRGYFGPPMRSKNKSFTS